MATVLYIQGSPRGKRSRSTTVADALIEACKRENPEDQIITVDLFHTDLPSFDGPVLEAKYAILHGQNPTGQQKQAWKAVEQIIHQFTSADRYVLSVPMWNFGLPYRLKHYFDILIQPGYTFSFDPETGYKGMVTGKPAAVVYARGGSYPPGTPMAAYDFQKPYLDTLLRFIGFETISSIVVEPTLQGDPQEAESMIQKAMTEARRIASKLSGRSPSV
ncbi:MAG: NAD(P)H-dependent oxidoreductase [Sedimentisphaerales bacterium]|nr:NAD(P)H-dependent oxidoreductase [Sedimentisphaerales bacterium]